jgi:hypothetical protein
MVDSPLLRIVIEGRQEVQLPKDMVQPILGYRIFRLDDGGDRRVRITTGHYGDPFKVLHQEQDIHHGFDNPFDAFLQTVHQRVWEGAPVLPSHFPDDGEFQKLTALLATERTLQLLASDRIANGPEREAFEKLVRTTARRLGLKRNEAMRRVMELLIQVATTPGEDAEQLFNDMLGLTEGRRVEVGNIGTAVNWRSAVLLREIHWQQAIMSQTAKIVAELLAERPALAQDLEARVPHLRKVDELIVLLRRVKDRPFYGQAARNIRDLLEYRARVMNHFEDSATPLERISVTGQFPSYTRELYAIMFLFGNSRGQRGSKRDALRERVHQKLIELKRRIGDPARADSLDNNPLWAVLGYINDALTRLHGQRNWDATKLLVRKAIQSF